jgi:uncharacterized GH25 family protein
MKRSLVLSAWATLCLVALSSHDMFLRLTSFYVKPNTETQIQLINGTFEKSENVISRDRMQDVSVVSAGKRTHPGNDMWSEADNITTLKLKTGAAGTYVAGLSTLPKMIELSAKDFADYLVHDGLTDMFEARKKSGEDANGAKEKYSKHVKTFFQVGDKLTDDYKTQLGYPVEFVPVVNPYSVKAGSEIQVQLLKQGKPLAGELVYASYLGYHSHAEDGSHKEAIKTRTDANGMVKVKLDKAGQWYLRTINMVKSTEPGVNYESNWATITFEVK